MIYSPSLFSPTELMKEASDVLIKGAYRQVSNKVQEKAQERDTAVSRLFENEYNLVGVVVYETCAELLRNWPDKQESLARVVSKFIGREEQKSWDGYLVLLTPENGLSESRRLDAVRYDTSRLRKLVATGDNLRSREDVERLLSTLVPLEFEQTRMDSQSALDLLPTLLVARGIEEENTLLLVDAFRNNSLLLEKLHNRRRVNENSETHT